MNDLSSYSDADLEGMLRQQHAADSAPPEGSGYNPKVYPRTPGVPTIEIIGGANSPKKEPGALGYLGTTAAGFNKGILANIGGLPVDTIQNLMDMGKGALSHLPGQQTNDALAINSDRSNTVGSSDWIAKMLNKAGAGDAINNNYPDDPIARGLYAAGQGVSGLVGGGAKTYPQLLRNAALLATGGAASQGVGEATGDPILAAIAGLTPQAISSSASGATKWAFRGGEAGRQNIVNTKQQFDNADVGSPTVAQATQGGPRASMNQMIENFLSKSPFAYGVFQNKANDLLGRLKATLATQVENAGGQVTPTATGKNIQKDILDFKNKAMQTYTNLEDKGARQIPQDYTTIPTETMRTGQALSNPTPNSFNTNAMLGGSGAAGIADAIIKDTKGNFQIVPQPSLVNNSTINTPQGSGPGYNWHDLRTVKSRVGEKAFPEGLSILPPGDSQGGYRNLYGALQSDINTAARNYSPEAANAFNRSNKFYTSLMGSSSQSNPVVGRLHNLDPLIGKTSPEDVTYGLEKSLSGKNPDLSSFNAIKKSIQPEQRAAVATTVIDRLGKATPGAQSAENDAWDVNRFLTNYSNLQPAARDALFSGFAGADKMRAKVDAIAKVAENIKNGSKVFANPSGTGAFVSAENSLVGVGAGVGGALLHGNPLAAAAIAAVPPTLYGAGRLATSKAFVDWLANKSSPSDARQLQMMLQMQNPLMRAIQGRQQPEAQ